MAYVVRVFPAADPGGFGQMLEIREGGPTGTTQLKRLSLVLAINNLQPLSSQG